MLRKESEGYTSFTLDRPGGKDEPPGFVPNETYFEVRLVQMFLRYDREYWRTFIPITSTLVEFSLAGQRRMVPFVIGPQLLQSVEHVEAQDRIEFTNRRIAGPQPYEGDDVTIFAGLFRMEDQNWAKQALSFAEALAKTFDASRLTSYINVAGPLAEALQTMLGMSDVELRLGVDRSYATTDPGGDVNRAFTPRYEVVMAPGEPVEETEFSVKGGSLSRNGEDYRDGDFILLEIAPSATRNDYARFPFYTSHWKRIVDYAWDGQEPKAWDRFRLLAGELALCHDIIPTQRRALFSFYKSALEGELARFREVQEAGGEAAFEGDIAPKEEITEEEHVRAARASSDGAPAGASPDEFLAAI
jgi:hypothetical protein